MTRPVEDHSDGAYVDDERYLRTRRMAEQRWLLDQTIRTVGVDWDQGRTFYTSYPCGLDAQPDFARIRERVRKFADIHREFAAAAQRREQLAEEAEAAGRSIPAREHAFVASILWGNAEWPLFGDSPLVHEYGRRKTDCFLRFVERSPHPIRRVEIPFRGAVLPGYLHLPPGVEGPVPCVVHIGGMDSFKEHRVAMYGDKFLERGIAQFTVEIPGQGEALVSGLRVTEDSAVQAGHAIVQWVNDQAELDSTRIGLAGTSFGSFWATQIAAAVEGLAGCAVSAVIHEPGMRTLFEQASPTFKARFMYMAGYTDEAAFDEFASTMDLRGVVGGMSCPHMVVAGEDDELSPLQHTLRLLQAVPTPVSLVVYQGERHSVSGGPASAFGPNRHHLAADWFLDRFHGVDAVDEYTYVDTTGRAQRRPVRWR